MNVKLAIDIKRNFPDLQVFDRDDMAFVKGRNVQG